MQVEDEEFSASAEGDGAVECLAQLSRERMLEREKTKRLLIGSVTVLVIVAAVAIAFLFHLWKKCAKLIHFITYPGGIVMPNLEEII